MPNGRSHTRGFLRYLHVQNGRGRSKPFETYILQVRTTRILQENVTDTLFDALNSYHPNIKFTLEQNPKGFLDTQIIKENNRIKTQVFVKKSMYPVHCSSKVPFRYKKNAINGELHRAKKIFSNFKQR